MLDPYRMQVVFCKYYQMWGPSCHEIKKKMKLLVSNLIYKWIFESIVINFFHIGGLLLFSLYI